MNPHLQIYLKPSEIHYSDTLGRLPKFTNEIRRARGAAPRRPHHETPKTRHGGAAQVSQSLLRLSAESIA